LNFSWPGFGIGKRVCGGRWIAQNLKKSELMIAGEPVLSEPKDRRSSKVERRGS